MGSRQRDSAQGKVGTAVQKTWHVNQLRMGERFVPVRKGRRAQHAEKGTCSKTERDQNEKYVTFRIIWGDRLSKISSSPLPPIPFLPSFPLFLIICLYPFLSSFLQELYARHWHSATHVALLHGALFIRNIDLGVPLGIREWLIASSPAGKLFQDQRTET